MPDSLSRTLPNPGLASLKQTLNIELARLGLPRAVWTPNRPQTEGAMLDVLVIGAGQFGTGVTAALKFAGVGNILMIDSAPEGQEGPWVTHARMPTLRSPKTPPGPCYGVPALTFQSWYRANYGDDAWDALYKIPNQDWQDYILWVRRVLALPVCNERRAVDLVPHRSHVAVTLSDGDVLRAKRVVVATGRGATGGWSRVPEVSEALWPDLAAHTMEEINFDRLRGKRVAVLGGGSAAWDNAATALETGAASVDMYVRRKALPQVNKGRASVSMGYLEGWMTLPDADRWKLAAYMNAQGVPPPYESVLRALDTPGLSVHLGARCRAATRAGDRVRIEAEGAPDGNYDFLILGSGFRVDLAEEPLFASLHDRILLWGDRYTPPPELANDRLARQPYLGPGFELIAKTGPALDRIHLFNAASWVSAGSVAADVPSLDIAPDRLVGSICRQLFAEDFETHFAQLQTYQDEHELEPTPFHAPEFIDRRES